MTDPIGLDLGGSGINLVARSDSSAFFDIHGSGFAVQTGWIGPQNGFLVVDKNGDGQINDISELFGSDSTDGFTALRSLDLNGDGIIDASDPGFASLKVWIDANQDGIT